MIEKLFNDIECPPYGGVLELTRKKDISEGIVKVKVKYYLISFFNEN